MKNWINKPSYKQYGTALTFVLNLGFKYEI